jgi:hypothetical protein
VEIDRDWWRFDGDWRSLLSLLSCLSSWRLETVGDTWRLGEIWLNISGNKLTKLMKEGMPHVCLGADRQVFLKGSVLQWLKNREK